MIKLYVVFVITGTVLLLNIILMLQLIHSLR